MKSNAERSYRWLFWLLALLGLAADQSSKYGLFYALYDEALANHPRFNYPGLDARVPLIDGAFDLRVQFTNESERGNGLLSWLRSAGGERLPQVNHGALAGLGGRNAAGEDYNTLFLIVSLIAAAAITGWSVRRGACREVMLAVALGLILAGTLGNLYDRVVFDGVRDFLYWHGGFEWPVFNLADSCLVCGASLLLLQALTAKDKAAGAPRSADVVDQQPAVLRQEDNGAGSPTHDGCGLSEQERSTTPPMRRAL